MLSMCLGVLTVSVTSCEDDTQRRVAYEACLRADNPAKDCGLVFQPRTIIQKNNCNE